MALSAGGTLSSSTRSLTDANAQRIIAHHRTRYGMSPSSTAAQVWARIDEEIWDVLKTRTINGEREASIASLTDTPIT
jgi:hypothetical protein